MSHNTRMPQGLLPLFPLEVVLLPHTPLPLHIFEERYKLMIAECLEKGSEFGVVLVRGKGVLRTGCAAEIEKVLERYDDGRLDILALGRRRFEIRTLDTSLDWYRAEVEYFDDDDYAPVDHLALENAKQWWLEYRTLAASGDEPPKEAPELSFQLASVSQDLAFRQGLLELRSEAARVEKTAAHLREMVERRRLADQVRRVAPLNGHSKHLGEGKPKGG